MTDENVLIVQADSAETSLGWASLGERRWRCTVGAGGIREDKVEGDSATPVGEFPLRRIYFRNDRVVLPKTGLPARPINEHDGWCDDPPEGEWGSAIFLHIARDDYAGTQGCVAFSRDDLLELLPLLNRDTRLRVLSHAADEEAQPRPEEDERMKQFEDFDEKDW